MSSHSSSFVVATGVGFEEQDITFREGRDRDLIFLQKDPTPNDVLVRILLLEVGEFQAYRNRTGRVFSQEILDIIDAIEVPATGIICYMNVNTIKHNYGHLIPQLEVISIAATLHWCLRQTRWNYRWK